MTRIASHRAGTLEFGDSTPPGFPAAQHVCRWKRLSFDLHQRRWCDHGASRSNTDGTHGWKR